MENKSAEIAKIAIKMALSTREEENRLNEKYEKYKIKTTAVDIGGKLPNIIPKIIENTLVASKRKHIIQDCHVHDGAVAGAIREAIAQVMSKTNGLSVGGKIGIARNEEHISIAVFFSIGLLHLNEVVTAVAHRSIPILEGEIWSDK
ncbi:MAG: hypothetical protein PWP46_852 [Fusobacteriaceae bacterium]|nr:hypothetical protein [Fusobacteriaceae bacterium]